MADQRRDHWLANKRIIIAGAGVSGLAFAIAMHKLWPSTASSPPPPLILYERDTSVVPAGREGYSLSLRSDRPSAGVQTLQKLGLLDKMLEVSITSLGNNEAAPAGREGGFVIWDRDWKQIMKVRSKIPKGCPVSGMRINRKELRRTLVETAQSLPNVTIHWNTTITGVSVSAYSSSSVEVELKGGTTATCDILVAADGSSSKLRTLLRSRDRLRFAGPTCIFGTASISTHPSGHSNEFGTIISGEGTALFVAPIDQQSIVWSLSWHTDTPSISKKQPLLKEECAEILSEAREHGRVFGQRFDQMAGSTLENWLGSVAKFNAQDKMGFVHSGGYIESPQHQGLEGKIVFLGDANHAVSPFAGNGANLALMDGADFAESLITSGNLAEAIGKYDKLAVGRAKQVVQMSHFSIKVMHAEGARLWFYLLFLRVVRFLFFLK